MRSDTFAYLPKDFIQTYEGLIFAVVSYQPQDGKVGCFLRYIPNDSDWKKVNTDQANQLLKNAFPDYLYHSKQFETTFHAVPVSDIVLHHKPEDRLQTILRHSPTDDVEQKLHQLTNILEEYDVDISALGLTGSMLIGQQTENSDIDFAIYGRQAFQQARQAIAKAIEEGVISELDFSLMQDNFERRASSLSFEEFAWHEHRKFNKAAITNTKFDIGMVCLPSEFDEDEDSYQKIGQCIVKATVTDAERGFDFPAYYQIDNDEIEAVLSFTHTYIGQALQGEKIEVAGSVEKNLRTNKLRLVVGSSREAVGEYIKVIDARL